MSLTLATVADALIEFILSLLRDPDVAAEFEDDPEQALISRGLNHASASDVAAVAPVIIERTQVVQVAVPRRVESESHGSPVIREIKQVVSNVQWVDDRDTIVDQSVNQNIWAEGDVTQTFDNEAVVASGDDAVAAGDDALVDRTNDQSTTIDAGEDVNIGNDTDVQLVDGSFNEDSEVSSTVDESVDVVVEDSLDDSSEEVVVEDSFNEQTTAQASQTTAVTEQVVDGSTASQTIAEPSTEIPIEDAPLEPVYDAAAEYVETAVDAGTDVEFDTGDALGSAEGQTDDNF